MKKIIDGLLIVFTLLGLNACGPSGKVTYSWKNTSYQRPAIISKIFVAALVRNPHVREHLEEDMANATVIQGYTAEKSMNYFTPHVNQKVPPSVESMMEKIRELQCDLIFTVNLTEKTSETRYVPGNPFYGPFPGYGLHFRGFYSYWYPFYYDTGYYVTDRKYFMEGNLFDAKTGILFWTIQTESLNPTTVEKFSKELIDLMLRRALLDLGNRRS